MNPSDVHVSGANRFLGIRWVSSNYTRDAGSDGEVHGTHQPFSGVPQGQAREGGERIR